MTKARDLANLISGGFTEADIPNLSASKLHLVLLQTQE